MPSFGTVQHPISRLPPPPEQTRPAPSEDQAHSEGPHLSHSFLGTYTPSASSIEGQATPIQVEEGRCGGDGAAECGVIIIEGVINAVWSILSLRPSVTFYPDSFFASILSRVHEELLPTELLSTELLSTELLPTEPHAGLVVPTVVSLDHSPGDDTAAHGLLPSSVIPFMWWII